jgi:hypothetical protein
MTLAMMSLKEMREKYADAASEHGRAMEVGDHRTANRCHDIIVRVKKDLYSAGSAGLEILENLMLEQDPGVRTWAATHMLEHLSDRAEQVLEEVARQKTIVGLCADTTLKEWRRGRLHLA